MKKAFIFTFVFILAISVNKLVIFADSPPEVNGDGAIVMDATTGEVLYSKNPDTKYPPASTTKTLTALITLEKCNLNDVVTVSNIPPYVEGSKIGLFPGEQITVWNLLNGLLIESGNDCAEALAEHISGSIGNFAELMNRRATELGCTETHFVNPHGLYDDNHRTSPRDLTIILRELIKHPEFHKISTSIGYKIPADNKAPERGLWNKNKLCIKGSKQYYEGIIGAKTGYTNDSKFSYVAAATRNGETLLVAIMHDKKTNCFEDATKLLNYCFNNFTLSKVYSRGDIISQYNNKIDIPLIANDDVFKVFKKNEIYKPTVILNSVDLSNKSFNKNDYVMDCTLKFKDNVQTIKLNAGKEHIIKKPCTLSKKTITSRNIYSIVTLNLITILLACSFYFYNVKLKEEAL